MLSETDVIDRLWREPSANLVHVSIIDDQDWRDDPKHLSDAQRKFDFYLRVILNGDLQEHYRIREEERVVISYVVMHRPSRWGIEMLRAMNESAKTKGIGFTVMTVAADETFEEISI